MFNEFNEIQLKHLCNKYNIKYKLFETTGTVLLDCGFDEWQIKYVHGRDRPYCLMHKNKIRQTNKFHVQRYLRTIPQLFDCIINHKKIIINMFPPFHKKRQNTKINKRRNNY